MTPKCIHPRHAGNWFRRNIATFVSAALLLMLGSSAWAQSTYTWSGGKGPAPWTDADNWTPSRLTAASDDIIVINTPATITGIPLETIGQLLINGGAIVALQAGVANTPLTIDGGTGDDFVVEAGSALQLNGTALQVTLSAAATGSVGGSITATAGAQRLLSGAAGALVFQSGSVMTAGTGFTGNIFGTTSLNSVVFQGGSLYVHVAGSNPFGAAQPSSVVTFETGSRFRLDGNASPAASGRTYADLEYNATGTNSITGSAPLSIDNLFITQGTMNCNMTGLFSLRGNVTVNSGATLNFSPTAVGTVSLNGPSAQTLTVNGAFSSNQNCTFSVNNSSGIVLGSNLTIGNATAGGGVSFLSGRISTGANQLTIGSGANISGAGQSSGWVAGNLVRNIPLSGTRTMDVGDASVYAPVALQVSGVGAPFNLAASTAGAQHPALGSSGLDAGRGANRAWSMTPQGSPSFTSYDATFSFASSDLDPAADPFNFEVRRYNGINWFLTTTGTLTANSTQATGISAFSDFAVGEPGYVLVINVVGNGSVVRSPNQPVYDDGTPVMLTATPGSGYQFMGWSGSATGAANPLNIVMDSDKNITATFTPITYTLDVTIAGTGSVTKDPDQPSYVTGSLVNLTATPGAGYQFVGWSGDASGDDNPLSVTMDADKAITATFVSNTYTLSVNVVGSGTVTKSPDQPGYDYGVPVDLTATPASGYQFIGWSGDASGNANPLTVIMDADKTITATFAATGAVVISQIYGGGGNSGAQYHNDFIELFNRGGVAIDLTGWSVQYASASGATWATTTLSGSIAAGGYYLIQQAAGTGGGAALPAPDATGAIPMNLASGKVALVRTSTALTGTCPTGGDLADFVGYGAANCAETAPTGVLSNTNAAHRKSSGCADTEDNANDFLVSAPTPRNSASATNACQFALSVSITPSGSGSVTIDPQQALYPAESTVQLTAVKVSGFHFAGWTGDVTSTTNPLTVLMNSDKTLVAHFEPNATVGLVVISQIYGGGGNIGAQYTHDFIELYNRGNVSVDITGWSLQYASDSGAVWFSTNLIGSIPAGGYYLVREAAGAGNGVALPTPDAIGSVGLSAIAGKVALVNHDDILPGSCPTGPDVIDFVGYGRANCAEVAPAAAPNNTSSAHRRENGCVDSGNNLADFLVASPAPRNSATPASFCPIWTGTEDVVASEIQLGNIAPNPARGPMRVPFALPREADVRLSVHDLQGRLVTTLADRGFVAGQHELIWDGRGRGGVVHAGVYFIRLQTAGETFVRRVSVMP
jgi:uncharacterized repeat protein (TIGR02543 family)